MKDYSLSNEIFAELEKLHRGLHGKRIASRLCVRPGERIVGGSGGEDSSL